MPQSRNLKFRAVQLQRRLAFALSSLRIPRPSVLIFLTLFWAVLVYTTERTVFNSHISACSWDKWESWPEGASPNRVALVADPQLVDPHTYPSRPWPLSAATVTYADQFLRRSYDTILRRLDPDTILFLGDLFDGGREWSTRDKRAVSPDKKWHKYGNTYWLSEFERFGRIFFDPLKRPRKDQSTSGSRKVIAGLPGNHDLSIGSGVQLPVRDRFVAHFGESNRVDVIGNHTFVSIDSLSLTALDAKQQEEYRHIWEPTASFLDTIDNQLDRAVQREVDWIYNRQKKGTSGVKFHSGVVSPDQQNRLILLDEPQEKPFPQVATNAFPKILLSHVPLYRLPGTPCGPLRERFPPSEGSPSMDTRNALRIARGYQYQNVLTPAVTKYVTDRIPTLRYVFSGDDHDYCDVMHQTEKGNRIREVTVKSLSWAMGVRKPGFVLLSLWNPVGRGEKEDTNVNRETLQLHLCLLPDQVGLYLRYLLFMTLSLIVLALRAHSLSGGKLNPFFYLLRYLSRSKFFSRFNRSGGSANDEDEDGPILPMFEKDGLASRGGGGGGGGSATRRLSVVGSSPPLSEYYASPQGYHHPEMVDGTPGPLMSGFCGGLRPASSSISSAADTPITPGTRGQNRRRNTLTRNSVGGGIGIGIPVGIGGVGVLAGAPGAVPGSGGRGVGQQQQHQFPRSTVEYLKMMEYGEVGTGASMTGSRGAAGVSSSGGGAGAVPASSAPGFAHPTGPSNASSSSSSSSSSLTSALPPGSATSTSTAFVFPPSGTTSAASPFSLTGPGGLRREPREDLKGYLKRVGDGAGMGVGSANTWGWGWAGKRRESGVGDGLGIGIGMRPEVLEPWGWKRYLVQDSCLVGGAVAVWYGVLVWVW